MQLICLAWHWHETHKPALESCPRILLAISCSCLCLLQDASLLDTETACRDQLLVQSWGSVSVVSCTLILNIPISMGNCQYFGHFLWILSVQIVQCVLTNYVPLTHQVATSWALDLFTQLHSVYQCYWHHTFCLRVCSTNHTCNQPHDYSAGKMWSFMLIHRVHCTWQSIVSIL